MAGHGELAGKFPVEKQWFMLVLKKTEHSELRNTDIFVCMQKKKGGNYGSRYFLNAKFGAPPPPTWIKESYFWRNALFWIRHGSWKTRLPKGADAWPWSVPM